MIMPRPLSLGARLTLLFAFAAALVFPVFGWVISGAMDEHFEEGDIAELETIAGAVERALADAGVRHADTLERRFNDILIGHHHASLLLAAKDGTAIFESSGPDLTAVLSRADEPASGVEIWNSQGSTYRVLTRGIADHRAFSAAPATLVVATPIDYHLTFLASFRQTLWIMIASSIVVMSLMGWIAVRQGHAPLRRIAARMRLVSGSEQPAAIGADSVPRELASLAESFNEMLRRVDDSFQRLTNFNADIAHELRTPITNLMTQTEVALTKARGIDEYREVLYSNMEEYERMAQMIGDMLFLAQNDAGVGLGDIKPVDLADETRVLIEYYEGWAEERGVSLAAEGAATVLGDRRMLQRALGNLISNAIRYCKRNGTVQIGLEIEAGTARVTVSNPGTAIAATDLPRLFDRFYRADASRRRTDSGAGLGLAIVRSIVEAHDGRITVESTDTLTTFTLILPAP